LAVLRNLSTYRKKRDFEITGEPSGDVKVAPAKQRRFVIQKHDATRLHYDLRLEFDGVFKSWAVTKGPSLDPHDKRLAVEVEDHPLEYGDFEGTIPEGQYGGGTVMLWDRGYWESDDPERGFKKGDLKFTLHGDKLHGSFVLVRMRNDRTGGKRTNWLLIKHRDEFVKEGEANDILEQDKSVASGRSMQQIAQGKGRAPKPFMLAKDGRARAEADAVWQSNRGEAAETRVKTKAASPKARASVKARATVQAPKAVKARKIARMPDFVAPELCISVERPPSAEGWCHEIKFDGYRMQLRARGWRGRAEDTQGPGLTDKFSSIAKEGSGLPDVMIDGEIVASTTMAHLHFRRCRRRSTAEAKISSSLRSICCLPAAKIRALPLGERKARLKQLLTRGRARTSRSAMSSISKAAATQCCNRPASLNSKASSPRSLMRPIALAVRIVGPRPYAVPAMRSCSAAGRPPTANSVR
jgi:bifunctional non-homologous end joining protein LigD